MAESEEKPVVVVDGSNVAYAVEGGGPRLANILAVCEKLEGEGYQPLVLVDARLRHTIDDAEQYEQMVQDGRIRQAPAGTDADYFILSFARELDARVISNDRFRSREEAFADVTDSVIRFMVVGEEVVLERRNRRRDS